MVDSKRNTSIITIDVDWAPDFIIEEIAKTLIRNHTKATWFITHDSEATRALSDTPELFEVGVHPNFRKDSTQGSTPQKVMEYLKRIAPDAVSVRTHSLIQSSVLLRMLTRKFGILNDVSLLLPRTPHLVPHKIYFTKNLYLTRLPYFWQDDIEAFWPKPSYSLKDDFHHSDGLKIYNFHPVTIALNMSNFTTLEKFRSHGNIPTCTSSDIEKFRNKSQGSGTFFKELITNISGGNTIKDIAEKWEIEHP